MRIAVRTSFNARSTLGVIAATRLGHCSASVLAQPGFEGFRYTATQRTTTLPKDGSSFAPNWATTMVTRYVRASATSRWACEPSVLCTEAPKPTCDELAPE